MPTQPAAILLDIDNTVYAYVPCHEAGLKAAFLGVATPMKPRFAPPTRRRVDRQSPHKSVSAIAAETRMGKGKGEPEYWCAVVKPGLILFEIGGLAEAAAKDCLARVAYKMPFKCRFVKRLPSV